MHDASIDMVTSANWEGRDEWLWIEGDLVASLSGVSRHMMFHVKRTN